MRYILAAVLVMSSLHAQTQTNVPRPHLPGLAHVAFRVSDMPRTLAFYENLLGYQEPFSLNSDNGKPTISFIKVNDLQYVELFPGDARSQGQLDHFALYTDDLTAMRAYLSAQKVPIVEDIHQGRIGNSFLTIRDPDGHPVEILQYSKTSLTARSQGKFMPTSRVSSHITHVGILVSSVGSAMKFYRDMLGFREFFRGAGGGDGQPGWVDLQIPDGSDYIELIPYSGVPTPVYLKAQNHFSLVSSDVQKTIASLQTRATMGLLTSSLNVENGGNLPPRTNLFDPDGARVEIMEPMSAVASAVATSYP
jgi:catechol 2,3-dioxygenase-like lactoylglutathione lyase family enzyme